MWLLCLLMTKLLEEFAPHCVASEELEFTSWMLASCHCSTRPVTHTWLVASAAQGPTLIASLLVVTIAGIHCGRQTCSHICVVLKSGWHKVCSFPEQFEKRKVNSKKSEIMKPTTWWWWPKWDLRLKVLTVTEWNHWHDLWPGETNDIICDQMKPMTLSVTGWN